MFKDPLLFDFVIATIGPDTRVVLLWFWPARFMPNRADVMPNANPGYNYALSEIVRV